MSTDNAAPYFTVAWIEPGPRHDRITRDPQAMHVFLRAATKSTGRHLWRLEKPSTSSHTILTTITPAKPVGLDTPTNCTSLKHELDDIAAGRHMGMTLIGNTVTCTKSPASPSPQAVARMAAPGRNRGIIVPLKTVDEQTDWLTARMASCGLELLAPPTVSQSRKISFYKGPQDRRQRVTLQTARFDAQVTVVDADLARKAATEGVGRARSYGCGLLTLTRSLPKWATHIPVDAS